VDFVSAFDRCATYHRKSKNRDTNIYSARREASTGNTTLMGDTIDNFVFYRFRGFAASTPSKSIPFDLASRPYNCRCTLQHFVRHCPILHFSANLGKLSHTISHWRRSANDYMTWRLRDLGQTPTPERHLLCVTMLFIITRKCWTYVNETADDRRCSNA